MSMRGNNSLGDPFKTIGFALKMAQQALRSHLDAALQGIGLTTPQYAVLTFLEVEPGASNAALARRAFVTPQTMQGILVALERASLIFRTPHPEHGRVQTTELTTKGAQGARVCHRHRSRSRSALTACFSASRSPDGCGVVVEACRGAPYGMSRSVSWKKPGSRPKSDVSWRSRRNSPSGPVVRFQRGRRV